MLSMHESSLLATDLERVGTFVRCAPYGPPYQHPSPHHLPRSLSRTPNGGVGSGFFLNKYNKYLPIVKHGRIVHPTLPPALLHRARFPRSCTPEAGNVERQQLPVLDKPGVPIVQIVKQQLNNPVAAVVLFVHFKKHAGCNRRLAPTSLVLRRRPIWHKACDVVI